MSAYYYISCQTTGLVIQNMGASVAVSLASKSSGASNQLWQQVATGPVDGSGGQSEYQLKSKLDASLLSESSASLGSTVNATAAPSINASVWALVAVASPTGLRVQNVSSGLEFSCSGSQVVLATNGQGSAFELMEEVSKPAYATGRKKQKKGMGSTTVVGKTT